MNSKLRTYRAFTLIELVVAIGLLVMVISSAGMIFKISIETHRTTTANAEIMQKFRAITRQLNTDLQDLRKDSPLLIWFQQDEDTKERFDQIMFFSSGDFQSTQLYTEDLGAGNVPENYELEQAGQKYVRGNTARIYYGQAKVNDDNPWDPDVLSSERILARRQHILTAEPDFIDWPKEDMSNFDYTTNDRYEHDSLSLAQWKNVDPANYDKILTTCFGERSLIDSDIPQTFQRLMCEGVGSFTIQWAYWNPGTGEEEIRWFPSDNPDGEEETEEDSHFKLMNEEYPGLGLNEKFGVYFYLPADLTSVEIWFPIEDVIQYEDSDEEVVYFPEGFYPKAFKFTFTLYDSKGIIEGRRTFTHIVYLGG